jgi:hypothetical protein
LASCYASPVPAAACIRCFEVVQAEDSRPGVAPLCPACANALAAVVPTSSARAVSAPPARGRRRLLLGAALAAAVLGVLAAVAVAAGWIVL